MEKAKMSVLLRISITSVVIHICGLYIFGV